MPNHADRPHQPRPEASPLRVFRVEPGTSSTVWTLSPRYGGCFVHWCRGRNLYCKGVHCLPAVHNIPRTWKGYAPALVWEPPLGSWRPIVLELTESLELDVRGLWDRGQLWLLSKLRDTPKHKSPVVGSLLTATPANPTPEAFSIQEVLRHLYHVDDVDLSSKNPLPARQYMEPVQLPPPPSREEAAEQRTMTPAEWQEARKRMGLKPKPVENGDARDRGK